MWQLILAVSKAGWMSGEMARAVFFLTFFSVFILGCLVDVILDYRRRKRRLARWEREDREMEGIFQENRQKRLKNIQMKRRKDHPLTKIFKQEMPSRS